MIGRIAMAGVVIFVIISSLFLFGPSACNAWRNRGAQEKLDQGQVGALGASANQAIAIQGEANKRETESENLTRSNAEDIKHAEGADTPISPAVRAAGLRARCTREAYRDSEQCRLLKTHSK